MVSFARDQLIRKENAGYSTVASSSFCESLRLIEKYLRPTAVQSTINIKCGVQKKS